MRAWIREDGWKPKYGMVLRGHNDIKHKVTKAAARVTIENDVALGVNTSSLSPPHRAYFLSNHVGRYICWYLYKYVYKALLEFCVSRHAHLCFINV